MAKVATRGPMLSSSNSLQFSGGPGDGGSSEQVAVINRKTPSELIVSFINTHNLFPYIMHAMSFFFFFFCES